MDSLIRNIERTAGEKGIRDWATSIFDKYHNSFGTNSIVRLPKSDIPEWVPQLDGTFPFLSAAVHSSTSQNGESVWLVWASGRGSIGITMGRRSYVALPFHPNYYWKQAFPGIYVWHVKRV